MKAIYSSKLYRASKNKDRIKSAIADPINSELVKQLRSYLDEDYIDEDYLDTPANNPESKDAGEASKGRSGTFSGGSKSSGGYGGGHGSHSMPGEFSSEDDDKDLVDTLEEDVLDTVPDESDAGSSEEEVSESVDIADNVSDNCCPVDIQSIRDTLNSDDGTSGVSMVFSKGDEVWIHYNDDINLNNVMEQVISKLSDNCYNSLDFNRLARTDNAIVFVDTNYQCPDDTSTQFADEGIVDERG